MESKYAPNSIDEPNLLYKLQNKNIVFHTKEKFANRGYNVIASSSKYGIVFIAVPDGSLSVYSLQQLLNNETQHACVKLPESATHIAVSCDQELLAVVGPQALCIYKVTDFQNPNVSPSISMKTNVNSSTFVSALQWNPCIPDSLALAFHDGTLVVCQVTTNQVKKVQTKARCICWSPKGKQLVTGNSDGTLCQYKPDLTLAKTIPAPKLPEGSSLEALAVYWISTFQFAVVYKSVGDDSRPSVTIVNAGKTEQVCLNYEDVCFSMGSIRPWYYFLLGITQWNIILASSSNSMEIATMASTDGVNWTQWCQPDEARPELPLTDKKSENYPVGISFDTSAIHQLPWGENETLPYMPTLLVVSQTGLLTIFNVVNLNKGAPQICTPPQPFTLPAASLTSSIPGESLIEAAPIAAPVPIVQPKPQVIQQTPQTVQPQPPSNQTQVPAVSNFGTQPQPTSAFGTANIIKVPKPQFTSVFATAASNQGNQSQAPPVVKPTIPQQPPEPSVQAKPIQPQPKPAVIPTQPPPQVQENAALKEEQERLNKMKANQELKNMLVKEVNDFQMELYKFMVKTQETQAKLQRDIESISANFKFTSLDSEQLKKDCSLEDLRGAIIQLKLELVRTCALVAEARTHADTKDLQQWSQADPLTTKRVASVKKLAYYVQNQLEQAQKALDHKWNEIATNDPNAKPGKYMIRPKLDDVYQPLVKQQEILSRQQIVLRNLRNALKECDIAPLGKSTSLLRSTPFRNKDPLSKLTKNILNMSIEAETKTKKPLLTAQKYEALRDLLSNHKTVKIKPVDIEIKHHLATMRSKYEKAMQVKTQPASAEKYVNKEVQVKIEPEVISVPKENPIKIEPKTEPKQLETAPPFSPIVKPTVPGLQKVTRTLFTEPKPAEDFKIKNPTESFSFGGATYASNNIFQAKNDANHFMGQKICSPSAFSNQQSTIETQSKFTTKPVVSDISRPTAFEVKPVTTTAPKSSETGEPERTAKTTDTKNITKPTYMFGNPHSSFSNVPDVLKSHQGPNVEVKTTKPTEKVAVKVEKVKEKVPEKTTESTKVIEKVAEKENVPKTFVPQIVKPSPLTPVAQPTATVIATKDKTENKQPETNTSSLVSLLTAPSKLLSSTTQSKTEDESTKSFTISTTSASSIFGTAVASQPKTTSIFSSTTTQSFVFGEKTAESTPISSSESVKPEDSSAPKTSITSTVTFESTVTTSVITSSPSVFSTSTTSIFGTSTQSSAFSTPLATATTSASTVFGTATTQSVFGSTPSNTQASSIFGAAASQTFGTSTTQPSMFATATTPSQQSTIFATSTQTSTPSIFSSHTTQSSLFGSVPQTTQASVFGSSTQSTPASVFGSATPTTQASVLGNTTPTTQSSIFGTAPPTTQASVFGTATPTTQPSVFGTAPPTTQASTFGVTPTTQVAGFGGTTPTTPASVFGSATATTQASVFGGSTPTTQASLFGGSTPTTQASVFGSATSTTQPSVFGGTATTQASVFGGTTPTTQPSVFGSATPTKPSVFGTPTAAQPSVFGTPTQTTQTSVFGTPTQTTQSSIFGTPISSGSLFGGAEANLFASATISTTSATTPGSGGNIFGGSSGSVFGNSSPNVFGGNSSFGQSNSSASSIFGSKPTFGQTPTPNLWGSGNTTSTTGFGSTAFGQPATTQSSSIFGNTSGGSFSSPQSGQPFGSAQQTSPFGATEAKPSVFGSPQQQSASGFGGSAVFGSKPVFGQSAGFGSPTATGTGFGSFSGFNTQKSPSTGFGAPASFGGGSVFGAAPAFGSTSPGKVFGGASTPMSGFGATQSNATFENLATQNTLTFGNLAQQSGQPPQQAPPSFNTSPSFTGWRG